MSILAHAQFVALSLALAGSSTGYTPTAMREEQPCANIGVTTELEACLARSINADEAQLNTLYANILSTLTASEKKDLVSAERLWLAYRTASCRAEHDLYEGGTGGPPAELVCKEAEDRSRIETLGDLYRVRLKQATPRQP